MSSWLGSRQPGRRGTDREGSTRKRRAGEEKKRRKKKRERKGKWKMYAYLNNLKRERGKGKRK